MFQSLLKILNGVWMNKESIERRIQDIEESLKKTQVHFNMLEGAKVELIRLLSFISQESEQEKSNDTI